MSSAYALARLFRRPATLVVLFPVLLTLGFALGTESAGTLNALRTMGIADPHLVQSLWRLHGTIALLGIVVAGVSREPQMGMYGWTLPGLDKKLSRAIAVFAVICATLLGAGMATVAGTGIGIAVTGSSLLAFAVGMDLLDPVRSMNYRRVLFVSLLLALWKPEYLHRVALLSPIAFALVTTGAAVFIFLRAHSRTTMRVRPFLSDSSMGIGSVAALRAYWAGKKSPRTEWHEPFYGAGSRTWIRAAIYESFSGRSGGWFGYVAFQIILGVAFAYGLNGPWFIGLTGAQTFLYNGLQLRMPVLYPISRNGRADIHFLSSLFENALYFGSSAVAIWLLYSYGPGHLPSFSNGETVTPTSAVLDVAFAFALMPVVQWAKTKGPFIAAPGTSQKWNKYYLYVIAFLVPYMTATITVKTSDLTLANALFLAALLSVVVQGVYWFALHWHFKRTNLVAA
jgi:hypothetical protein